MTLTGSLADANADALDTAALTDFRPMTAQEVAAYLKLSVRMLEEWRRRTRDSGHMVGPPFFQDVARGRVMYPYIAVMRYATARSLGRSVPDALHNNAG